MNSTDLRKHVTDQIIEALIFGTIPWRKPWKNLMAQNAVSKNRYRGINVLLLQVASQNNNFGSHLWASFKQWKDLGARIKKGSKGTQIVFYKTLTRTETVKGEEVKAEIPLLRHYTVFNLDQVEQAPEHLKSSEKPTEPEWERAEDSVFATEADIRFGGNKAAYIRPIGDFPDHADGDFITCPHRDQFGTDAGYFGTLWHELAHWSEVRRGWNGSYAMGELIAEMTSCFISAELEVPQSDDLRNHAAYLESWLGSMEDDPKFIFQAAAQAAKATDFILDFSRQAVAV